MNQMFLRLLSLFLLVSLLLSGCNAPAAVETDSHAALPLEDGLTYGLEVAVLYDSACDETAVQDILTLLEQSPLLGLHAEAVDLSTAQDLARYDLVIPEAGLAEAPAISDYEALLVEYTSQGGYVLLDNSFASCFSQDYLGIREVVPISGCPTELSFPEVEEDLQSLQTLIKDYASLYPEFYDSEVLSQLDYGCGFIPDAAHALACVGDVALYTYRSYGEGAVLLTNPLLPNVYSLGNLSMTRRSGDETAFSATTASCNMLFYSGVATLVAKAHFGYALRRVYGFHGSPSMSWELHYEEITGIAHNSMQLFYELCQEYGQIPSYTLIRSSYWWFLRAESITYLLNQSTDGKLEYEMDLEESAYSSGTHIVCDGAWLQINAIENAGSYFREYPEYDYRAYPTFGNINGQAVLISGSADGYFYCYVMEEFSDHLHVSAPKKLTDSDGYPLQVTGYSAPQLHDLNGDGILDLVSGSSDGGVYWYSGDANGSFTPQGLLLETDLTGQTLPYLGDVDGDGTVDLILGSDCGVLLCYYGSQSEHHIVFYHASMESYSRICADAQLGDFLAPCQVDYNGDGLQDMVVGGFEGYLAVLLGDGAGSFTFDGYITLDEWNYKENNRAKFGNYAVPVFYDINGDGALDLVCGSLEYGMAYPIDSPYFPERDALEAQVAFAKEHQLYVGIHHYTNAGASAEREAYELSRHLEAFEAYGLPTEGIGANLHTWYSSNFDDTQTFDSEYAAGLLWNSGFSPAYDTGVAPQYAAENVIALPFFLQKGEERTLLVQDNSVLPYVGSTWTDLSGAYGMPVCIYYHCDFVYESNQGARDYLQKVSDFQWKFGYNFVREDQLMAASAAALNLTVEAKTEDGALTITGSDPSMGVEIAFSQDHSAQAFSIDADVYYCRGNSVYVGLNRPVTLRSGAEEEQPHLKQVNLPAEITTVSNGAEIAFQEDGMLQVVVAGEAVTSSVGWSVQTRDGQTIFTKYGEADTLSLRFVEETDQ